MLRAMSSARPITRLALMPGAGSSSYIVTTGPVRTAVISPLTLKSSSTFSSRRALRSSASLSSLGAVSLRRIGEQVEARAAGSCRTGRFCGLAGELGRAWRLARCRRSRAACAAARRRARRAARARCTPALARAGLNGLGSLQARARGAARSGSVISRAQSNAKTRPASTAPAGEAGEPGAGDRPELRRLGQQAGERADRRRRRAGRAMPPIEAGSDPPGEP